MVATQCIVATLVWHVLLHGARVYAFSSTDMHRSSSSMSLQKWTLEAKSASSYEEDLELTRKLIMQRLSITKSVDRTISNSKSSNKDVTQEKQQAVVEAEEEEVVEGEVVEEEPGLFFVKDRPAQDLLLRAARGEHVEQTPVWLFRQAGRHLPEYEAYKKKIGKNFWQMLSHPDSVVECTLQPLRRYKTLDAAILFSDILVLPAALGMQVTMPGGVGIQIPEPLRDPSDMKRRLPSLQDMTPRFVQNNLGHVITSVQKIRQQMELEGFSIPLIGFSAAPWTLLFYMVGGSSKKNPTIGVQWLQEYPEDSRALLQLLTKLVIEYLSAQVQAGAHILQIFEAMGMMVDEDNFEQFALPCLAQIASELQTRYPDIPLMVFARGMCSMNDRLASLGYRVITMDGSVDRSTARAQVALQNVRLLRPITLQGNYDPAELIEANGKTVETVRATAKQLLEELGPQRLIANLGEGLGGKESPVLVQAFIDAIHEESRSMIRDALATAHQQHVSTSKDTSSAAATSTSSVPMFFASPN
jgi:uroporphyrinogen decarboxylase